MTERVLRALALLLVVAAIIDPAITSSRASKPEIAVVASDSVADGALAANIARQLSTTFTVIVAPYTAAAGTVMVGSTLPARVAHLAEPLFAVMPDHNTVPVSIERVVSPTAAPLATRVPVDVLVRARSSKAGSVEATLQLGELVVDRVVRRVTIDDTLLRLSMSFVPTAPGAASLRATVRLVGDARVRTADFVIDVRDTRWPVLFYDARPSYMSTFVRRGLERDARFVVTSRVTASRGVTRDAGAPPSTLDDPAVRSLYNMIVVGAPELLGARDIAALGQFMRKRGGSVVLLYEQHVPADRAALISVGRWESATRSTPSRVLAVGMYSANLEVTDWMWPALLPENAEVLAWSESAGTDSAVRHPVVWQSATGAGRLIVSGALDAWKFRDPEQSGFDAFWQRLLATAADQSPPPVTATLSRTVVTPGQYVTLTTQLRDASLASASNSGTAVPVRTSLSAVIESTDSAPAVQRRLRMWPTGQAGQFAATFRTPTRAGRYRVHLSADGEAADVPFRVRRDASQATPADSDLLAAWARATGGGVLLPTAGRKIGQTIVGLLAPVPRRVSWHPMRSLWWLPLLSILLCGEWWLRRRRGLA